MKPTRAGAALTLPLCSALVACANVDWTPPAQGGSGPSLPPANGGTNSGGSAGSGGQGQGGSAGDPAGGSGGSLAGSGGSGGGGTAVFNCPADDGTAQALTLAGLGFSPNPNPADAGSLPLGDAGDAGAGAPDAGAEEGPELEFEGITLPGLVGWGASPGLGTATTIGGAAGEVVDARSAEELVDYASRAEPLVIRICGPLRAPEVKVSSHKTLLGVGEDAALEGGLLIGGEAGYTRNVVVKNLRVNARHSTVDFEGIRIEHAHHVWIDHSEIFDGAGEAMIDVVNGSDFVTLSWNKIHFTPDMADTEHRFGCRIGDHNMDDTQARALDTGHLSVTLHHNWWATDVRQRAPRVRFGNVHLFNNYYSIENLQNDYSIWASTESKLLVEHNYFRKVTNAHELNTPDAKLLARDNVYDSTIGLAQSTGTAFTPPYAYEVDPALNVPALVRAGVGPR